MKSNVIVALIIGAVLGFVVGRATESVSSGTALATTMQPPRAALVPAARDLGKTPADLPATYIKESDLPAGTLAGLTDQQKYSALKAANEADCDCGCQNDSIAKCRKNDPNCARAPQMLTQIIALAKNGKNADQIKIEVGRKPSAPGAGPTLPAPQFKKVDIASFNPSTGPRDAKVTIVEFSDFQCPFCSRVVPTVKQIEDTYAKDVRLVFRQQPLPFHPYAMPAAEAALAANEQGKFWPMHDKLFANQGKINAQSPMPDLERVAGEAGLDMTRFKAAMESHKFKAQVEEDSKYGASLGANGTPTFFVNGRLISGAMPFENFKTVIDEEIKKADDFLKKGVKPDQLYAKLLEEGAKAAAAAPAPSAAAGAPGAIKNIELGNAPIKGSAKASVTIVAFSDFQCPFCSRVEPTIKQIEDTYAGKVRIAWKNKPLPFHQFAMGAAEAAMAANAQGKFWEMHDKLFANQQALDRPALERYGQELGLDMNRFRSDLDSHKFKAAVEEDTRLGDSVGAGGTPTFFINGRMIVGAQPFDSFKRMVDEELAKKVAKN